jgi:DNA-directed RNA polymerase omega subunit
MVVADKIINGRVISQAIDEQWPGIDSMYRLIVVASQRNKQLLRGARPRIEANPLRRRNTSIALEEAKRGLVPFTLIDKAHKSMSDDGLTVPVES